MRTPESRRFLSIARPDHAVVAIGVHARPQTLAIVVGLAAAFGALLSISVLRGATETAPSLPRVLLNEATYTPGHYESVAMPLGAGAPAVRAKVCATVQASPIDLSGSMLYSTDGGASWREWSPFGMRLGDTVWDAKRGQFIANRESCASTTAAVRGWTHVRVVADLRGGDATLSAGLEEATADSSIAGR